MPKHLRLALRLLGERTTTRVSVATDSGAATPIRIASQKARALLYFVAMQEEHCASRGQLATILWEDRTDALARQNLRQTLGSLRQALGVIIPELLVVEGDIIRLRRDRLAVDAVAFAALACSKEPSHLERAQSLYRGDFLAGNGVQAPEFCDWVTQERARLQALAGRVFQDCARQWDVHGDGEQAIDAARRLVNLDPLREDWQRLLLQLYARHHGREAAQTHARAVVTLLRKELGVEPALATKALIARIDGGDMGNESASAAGPLPVGPAIAAVAGTQARPRPLANGDRRARLCKPSIAVLPFDRMGSDCDESYFAEGLHVEVVTALSNVRALAVASRDSTLAYAGQPLDARQIGRQLGVDYLVKGSIRRAEERVRVAIGLISAETGYHVFSRSFDVMVGDVLAAQYEIAAKLSASIEPHIYATEGSHALAQPVEALDARGCIVRALALINIRSKRNYTMTQKLLRRAIELNPDSAKAYSLMAYVAALEVVYGWKPRQRTIQQAFDAAVKAVLRDPQEPWAHFAFGFVHAQNRSTEQAIEAFNRALELNPNFAPGRAYLGSALSHLGKSSEALEQIDAAEHLSPYEVFAGVNSYVRANACFGAEKHGLAATLAARSVLESPGIVTSHRHLVVNHALAGEMDAAKAALGRLRRLVPRLSLESIKEALPYPREFDNDRFLDAFRRVGLK